MIKDLGRWVFGRLLEYVIIGSLTYVFICGGSIDKNFKDEVLKSIADMEINIDKDIQSKVDEQVRKSLQKYLGDR